MTKRDASKGTNEAWESRELGASEAHVRVPKDVDEEAIDDALDLHPISIRLQRSLIEDFKEIARIHGLGYQPLIRQILTRFVEAEKKRILRERSEEIEAAADDDNDRVAAAN
nr:hypothetical protein [Gammaproteobacteria bacterium]